MISSSLSILFAGLPAETLVDRYVTVGAYSLLRSCTIEPECIIGQHSILMEGSLVETNSILEAGSVLAPGRRIPTGELWAGSPARFVRKLTNDSKARDGHQRSDAKPFLRVPPLLYRLFGGREVEEVVLDSPVRACFPYIQLN